MADVTIEPDGITAKAAADETVLAALGRAGLRYRVGCRRGGCGICKVQLVVGEVRYERPIATSVLSDNERVAGICLSCRAVPITNVVIELQEGDRLRRVLGFAYPAAAAASAATAATAAATAATTKAATAATAATLRALTTPPTKLITPPADRKEEQ
ncbi:MAG TPA: 2Fe-2S iron-sulfur cluster-binding protein [Microlunatus sp.]